MRITRTGRLAILLAWCLSASFTIAQEQTQQLNAAECEWLLSHIGSSKLVTVAGHSLFLNASTAEKISNLRTEIASLGRPGVVVYAPVISAGQVAMLRFESESAGQPPRFQVRKTTWNGQTLRTTLTNAQQPGGDFFRRDLHRQLVGDDSQSNSGKAIFVFDPEAYGLVPRALELKDSVVLASPSLERSISNLHALESTRVSGSEFAAVLGFPSTEQDFKSVFGDSKQFGEFSEWEKYSHQAAEIVSSHGMKLLSGSVHAPRTKMELLSELQKQSGIVFMVAHADGARVILPGNKEAINITPYDIANLHFARNPFVILRVCQGEDHGFADAFLKAGAVGVWSNRGVIRADVAIAQVRVFLEQIDGNRGVLDAVTHVMTHDERAETGTTLLTELMSVGWGARVHASNR